MAGFDDATRRRFACAFNELQVHGIGPAARLDLKPLEGHVGWWRLRVGGYRAIFEVQGWLILVTRIGDRKNVYRA